MLQHKFNPNYKPFEWHRSSFVLYTFNSPITKQTETINKGAEPMHAYPNKKFTKPQLQTPKC